MSAAQSAVRIGMLTPSSNTVVEPLVAAMLATLPEVTAHAARLRVTDISLNEGSRNQFDAAPMLAAADLLADARVDVMGWNATSASWLGFDQDRRLCDMVFERFGIPCTSAVLACNDLLASLAARRIAFVTPYVDEVQERILAQYSAAGFECVAERHTGERVNYAFAEIEAEEIERLICETACASPDAIVVMCTNMRAAQLSHALEQQIDIPIIDSLAAFVWKTLLLADVDPSRIERWGRIFSCRHRS